MIGGRHVIRRGSDDQRSDGSAGLFGDPRALYYVAPQVLKFPGRRS